MAIFDVEKHVQPTLEKWLAKARKGYPADEPPIGLPVFQNRMQVERYLRANCIYDRVSDYLVWATSDDEDAPQVEPAVMWLVVQMLSCTLFSFFVLEAGWAFLTETREKAIEECESKLFYATAGLVPQPATYPPGVEYRAFCWFLFDRLAGFRITSAGKHSSN
jgi:hypothetical protein